MKEYVVGSQRKDGYVQVGRIPEPGDVSISYSDALALREVVALDFFDALPVRTLELDEHTDKSYAGVGFHATSEYGNGDEPSVFIGSFVSHHDDESWDVKIVHNRMKRLEYNNLPQRIQTLYQLVAFRGQLLQATKEVKIVRSIGDLSVDMIVDNDTPELRRAYQRLINPTDCEYIHTALARAIRRKKATRR